jgi:PTS system beta-glucosides-specific IIC component
MMNYEKTAREILANIGGAENVETVTHCVTRVRFVLKDESKADAKALKAIDGVMTVIQAGGQYQVVIGNEVEGVYDAVLKEGNLKGGGEVEADDDDKLTSGDKLVEAAHAHKAKQNVISRFLGLIAGIFAPALGILTASGMIKALLVILSLTGVLSTDSGTYIILSAVGDAVLYFFPVVLGWSSAKKFGMPDVYGIVLGAILEYPTIITLAGADPIGTLFEGTFLEATYSSTFLGIPALVRDYSTTVVPIILLTWVASYIYKWLNKKLPALLRTFFVPFLTLLIAAPLGFLVIGPVAMFIQNCISAFVIWLVNLNAGIAGLVLGSMWSLLVMFGLHWAVIPFFAINIAEYGYDVINPLIFAGALASLGSVIGVIIREKDPKEKSIEIPAAISTFFGVNEPALYGVLIPRKKVMWTCFLAAGVGGMIAGFSGAKLWAFSASGILGLPGFINPAGIDAGFIGLCIGGVVAFVMGLVTAMMIGAEKDA